MQGVKQITGVSCFLGCLESFLLDHGINKSQHELIKILHQKGLCTDEGCVPFPFENMEKACKELNLSIKEIEYHYPIDRKYQDGSLLIGTNDNGFHIRRFINQIEDHKITVMDPATGTECYWDESLMVKQNPSFYHLSLKMQTSVAILLGAGFSAPMGYPIGDTLNNHLLSCTGDTFAFHSSGVLAVSTDGKKPNFGYKTSYDIEFDFCRALIKYFYESRGYFDYEEFYDFMKDGARKDPNVEKLAKPFLGESGTVEQLIHALDNIFAQLIQYYLKDGNGEAYYDNAAHMGGPIFPGYTGILNCLKKLSEQYLINVHTLNHDLFFERLNLSDWINGKLCDGFEELGSPYYGKLDVNGRVYKVRLERYKGKYDKQFRLYKLHGSRNYGVYFSSHGSLASPENYLKTRYGIGFGELYKEKTNEKGELEYEHCWLNYHADFLTGTTLKIERYKEPLLYKKLFELFRQNLREAEMLLIVGYGGKDTEVNKMILENFDFKNKKSFIVDPYVGKNLNELAGQLSSTIITKNLDVLDATDFGI